ncbi:MAG TPA: phosphoribosylamine--glycine ligase [Candidatus Limnocylindrales bacterium]|nr:phosphoribosylamine--glycine ligase [Candidatus Limnocylindrales bacterium]
MRILVVGGGAREHALCWRLSGEPGVERVIVVPGNPLMADVAEVRADLSLADHEAISALAIAERVDLVVIGPEAPLVAGLADTLRAAGIACFGPSAAAARLEGSKAFAREICRAANVSMADGRSFTNVGAAISFADVLEGPVVVKADGLAAGKGVTVCQSPDEATEAITDALEGGRFGDAGRVVIVERFLPGVEASVIAMCDGERAVLLPAARDHKRLGEEDTGPNTGGMGAYSPVAELDAAGMAELRRTVFEPVLAEMATRGTPFRGALFCGLMLTADGPRVLEFNVRFGDPETQAILPRLATPLAPLLLAAARGRLDAQVPLPTTDEAAVGVTLAAAGYPDAPRSGDTISGLAEACVAGALVFGAGVAAYERGGLVTAGGRVLTVVGRGRDVSEAASAAYAAVATIEFEGKVVRRDIGRGAAAVSA